MRWSCEVCTFSNVNGTAPKCEICEIARSEAAEWTRTGKTNYTHQPKQNSNVDSASAVQQKRPVEQKSTVQATLFGGIVSKRPSTNPSQAKNKKSKVRSRVEVSAPCKQSTLLFDSKKSSTMFSDPPSTSNAPATHTNTIKLDLWKTTCPSNVSLDDLKQRTRLAMDSIFGVKKLRFLQPKAIRCALQRKCQLVIMATGGGKSLCYQLPAVVLGGTTIVVSPLIALMQDQSQALVRRGVSAAVLSSSNGDRVNREIMERLLGRSLLVGQKKKSQKASDVSAKTLEHITILYVTPEQVQTSRFREALTELHEKKQLTLFAIDEAHCLSSWGHDFRKAYMRLDYLRDRFPDVPLIACTATATAKVIEDIKKTLRLEQSPSYIGSFDRPNIFYKVKYKDSLNSSKVGGASQDLVSFIQKQHQLCFKKNVQCSGIVYCHTRADTEELASAIRKGTGIKTEAYHGGMKPDERQRVQESWTVGESQIAVATVAFGMGIDLAHVRYVVHWNLAKTPESFYQESGRAGRDGLPAFSVLYYSNDDANKFQFLLSQRKSEKGDKEPLRELSSLKEMVNYCMVPGCRRVRLLQHFGEKMDDPKQVCYSSCDYCLNPTRVQQAIEAASVANDFVSYTRMPEQKKRNPNDGHDDDNDDECMIKVWNVGDLHVTGTMVDDTNDFSEKQNKPVNFEKASSILAKYEAIECKSSGFVNFKQTTDTRVRVPQHLIPPTRSVSREPSHENVPVAKEVNVADLTAETNRLREALSKARTAKEEKQTQTLNGNKERRPPPPPPPIVLLATKRKR